MKNIFEFYAKLLSLLLLLTLTYTIPCNAQQATNTEVDFDIAAQSMQTLYTQEQGLLNNEANDIAQSSDGFIWVGSYSGLFRFNGKTFELIDSSVNPVFTSTSVRDLHISVDGTMYIATNEAGVFTYNHGIFTHILQKDATLSSSIRHVAEDSNGTIYVATSNGIGKIIDGMLVALDDSVLNNTFATHLAFDNQDILYVLGNDGALYMAQNDQLLQKHNWKDGSIRGIASLLSKTHSGRILVNSMFNQVYEVNFIQGESTFHPLLTIPDIGFIYNFYEDNLGRIWVLAEKGIGYLNEEDEFILSSNLELDTFIRNMCQDHEGNYWFASSRGGISHISQSKFFNELMAIGESEAYINATCIWQDQLYIASDTGLYIIANESSIHTELTQLFTDIRIRNLYIDSKQNLWIASYSQTPVVKVLPNGTIVTFSEDNGLPSSRARLITEKSDGTIWIGTDGGIGVIEDSSVIATYGESQGIRNTTVLSMFETDDNSMMIGSDGSGVYVILPNQTVLNYDTDNGLSAGVILRMAEDPNHHVMYVSTGSNTLDAWTLDGIEQVKNFTTDGNIFDIIMYKDKVIVLAARGLYIIDSASLRTDTPIYTKYGPTSGLVSGITANSWNYLDEDGTLYISCNESVYSINLDYIKINEAPSPVRIQSISIDGITQPYTDTIHLNSDARRITFYFSMLSYLEHNNSTITYQLKGFDPTAITSTSDKLSTISYTNLPSGTFTFELLGHNADGIPSANTESIKIIKAPHWYENPFMVTLLTLGVFGILLLIVWAIFQKRTKTLKAKQQEYHNITVQSLKAIARTIDAKDAYTNGHSLRVATYTLAITKRLNFGEEQQDDAYYTALLHDIGKIGIPDHILNKPGRLNEDEYKIIKKHVSLGAEILKDITLVEGVSFGAKYHHEQYDGNGYPSGLSGDSIPLIGRIICVADAFDAMTSRRVYQETKDLDYVIEELKKQKGKHFDPKIVDIFLEMIADGEITEILNDYEIAKSFSRSQ